MGTFVIPILQMTKLKPRKFMCLPEVPQQEVVRLRTMSIQGKHFDWSSSGYMIPLCPISYDLEGDQGV